eukprot:729463_1
MGNNLSTNVTLYDNKVTSDQSRLTKFIKCKLKKYTSTKTKLTNIPEADFIIQHKHLEQNNKKITDLNSFDPRRTVFVSLIGLFQTWKKCPCYILYTALIILPIKRQWLYYPSKYINEIQSHFIADISAFSDVAETKQFIQLLRWKDSKNHVFFMLDDLKYKQKTRCKLIDPFWFALNEKLTQLYDNVSKDKYKPLNLNSKYWQNNNNNTKFGTSKSLILCELYFVTMHYKTIQEIIYDSNPKSLNPIQAYGNNNILSRNESAELFDEFHNDVHSEDWWISEDYDPYDISGDKII